jgi:peptide deformylase
MIQKIISVKDPRLREKSKAVEKVDKKTLLIIQDLKDTLKAQKDPIGVGLAAPQIGKNVRIFAIKPKEEIRIFINPEIISSNKILATQPKRKEEKIMEGCLSLPNYYGPLERNNKITLKYLSESAEKKQENFEGFAAQIIQHEVDHLEGVLFIDHLIKQKKPLYELVNGEWEEIEL